MWFRRKVYKFSHPKADNPILVRAWNEEGAWDKFHNLLVAKIYGKWALSYNLGVINEIKKDCKCEIHHPARKEL